MAEKGVFVLVGSVWLPHEPVSAPLQALVPVIKFYICNLIRYMVVKFILVT